MLMSEKVRIFAWVANPSLQLISMPLNQSISNRVWLQGNADDGAPGANLARIIKKKGIGGQYV